ncbi:MAG: cytochrome b/b6 domain-containing protein [Steroidobacteraceae bacterium]
MSARDTISAEPTEPSIRTRRVLVWDVPTRLFHWLMVVLVAGAYLTERLNSMDWHVRIGEALLALVVFRLLWGWVGSGTARFGSFLASPAAALVHLRRMFRRETDSQVGHNPAGGWMVLVLLALLLSEALSGVYVNNDVANQGPLTNWVPASVANAITDLHAVLWDVLLAAVAVHISAIAFYAAKGQHVLRPMLTGHKILPLGTSGPRLASNWLALALLAAGALIAALASRYL